MQLQDHFCCIKESLASGLTPAWLTLIIDAKLFRTIFCVLLAIGMKLASSEDRKKVSRFGIVNRCEH